MNQVGAQNIDRISCASLLGFEQKYVLRQVPVIIEGLFDDQPISALNTIERLAGALGDVCVATVREYFGDFLRTGHIVPGQRATSTIKEYLKLLAHDPASTRVVTEHHTPKECAALISPPSLCSYRLHADGLSEVYSEFFIAGAGNVAHLHFDWDHRHVLLYQVCGRKRLSLVAPRWSPVLQPVLNMSLMSLESMREAERLRFLEYVSGYDAVLLPGDTIYIPPLMWHHLEYMDTAASLSFRYGRTRHGRIFHERFHPNWALQNFAWLTAQQDRLEGKAAELYTRMLAEYCESTDSGILLYRRMQTVFEEALREYGVDEVHTDCWPVFASEVEKCLEGAVAAGLLYPPRTGPSVASDRATEDSHTGASSEP